MSAGIAKRQRTEGYLSIAEAAKYADTPYHTLYGWLKAKPPKVEYREVAGKKYVSLESLNAYLGRGG